MKIIFSHDWLNGMRGGEKCLEALCEDYPDAQIKTLFWDKTRLSGPILNHPIQTSFIQKLPAALEKYRYYLPLFPAAIDSLDFSEADLILSTSHCVAKSAKKKPRAKHLCYCFTPMRYAWSLFDDYFAAKDPVSKALIRACMAWLRNWDLKTSTRVDRYVAISKHIQERIRHCYGREADVVYPPVDTLFYTPETTLPREDFYLVVSALVPYKRIDLAIEAFNRLKKPLVVIGSGPEKAALKKIAGSNIQFKGWQSDELIREAYRRAKGLIFPGHEDFGIVPVEAQACGCPVIALGEGGALETVVDGVTGVFFREMTVEGLIKAVEDFESRTFSDSDAVKNAQAFGRARFKSEMQKIVSEMMAS